MRIGTDVATEWTSSRGAASAETNTYPGAAGAMRNTLLRAWMHPTLWANDPDCLLAREARSSLTLDEVRALASAIGLTGGMLMLSDRVADLTLERLELAAGLLPPLPERALPTTYFGAGIPERVRVPIVRSWGAWLLVGLFNDSAEARQMRLDWDELGLEAGAYQPPNSGLARTSASRTLAPSSPCRRMAPRWWPCARSPPCPCWSPPASTSRKGGWRLPSGTMTRRIAGCAG